MSDDRHVRLSFPSKPEYLLLARLALSGIARHLPLDDTTLADLKLAVTEACGNAVRHAYLDGAGPVRVSFVVAEDRLQMIVEDQGVGLDAASPRTATVQPLEGGMGMAIIRAIVDELDVRTGADGRGTVVRMTKYLTGPAATS
ncbi:MAG TPA: ATP-binding protein [Gaiellaceae bacterium]|nr:ATP-binding protein [Gaiellaceae bacterium]